MKGKNNFEPMNFLSPQGQIIPFIKVLIKYVVAFKIIFIKGRGRPHWGSPRCGWRERERFAILVSEQSRVGFRDCVGSEEESSQPNRHQEFEGIRFFENFISHKNRVACDINPMF